MASNRPHKLIDSLNQKLGLTRDDMLAKRLGVTNSMLSKVRAQVTGVSPNLILRIYDVSGWSIEEIRSLINES
ncbi:hypothetical protein [Acinetobacter sp.]|uniref:hypothetical protein n=1 Tax=Acinetobacter sp. TaxID=472 RepID=UPI003890E547